MFSLPATGIVFAKKKLKDPEKGNGAKAGQTSNYNKYGVLYQYEAAKKACPDGWRLFQMVERVRIPCAVSF